MLENELDKQNQEITGIIKAAAFKKMFICERELYYPIIFLFLKCLVPNSR